MRFELMPMAIRKTVNIEDDLVRQTVSFDASLITSVPDYGSGRSTLGDGRAISSLSCTTFIRVRKDAEPLGILYFVPAYSNSELQIDEPDSLQLDVLLPSAAFDTLWNVVSCGKRIVLGGEVNGLLSQNEYGPGLAPWVWDIGAEENRRKDIGKFWFSDLVTASGDTAGYTAIAGRDGAEFNAFAKGLRRELREKYLEYSQMRRLSLQAVDQAEAEVVRRGLTGWDARIFVEDALNLVNTLQTALHSYGWKPASDEMSLLWHHQNLHKLFLGGRQVLGSWEIDQENLRQVCHDLLSRPWLRLDEMEWIVVSALVFREVFEFGESIKRGGESFSQLATYISTEGNLRKMRRENLKAAASEWFVRWGLVAAGMFGAWFFVERNHYEGMSGSAVLGGALLILIWLCVGFPGGRRAANDAKQEQVKLFVAMEGVYAMMKLGGPLSPYQIRAALLVAQEKGAVWPSGTFALLDRAAMRDVPVWVI